MSGPSGAGIQGEVCVVAATLRRPAPCGVCGAALSAGQRARVGVAEDSSARFVLCDACVPSAAMTAPLPVALASGDFARGSLAVWVAVGALGVAALLASRTVRRFGHTVWVGAKAAAAMVWARLRGRRGAGPAIVRRSFEDLGPTYIKLGQLIASSQGLFPEAYSREFRKCLDRVRPFAYADVQRIVRAELGRDPDEVFAWIDPAPLASASIAQVHAARLHDGQEVVVKVQRPKIDAVVEADLRILRLAAKGMALSSRGELANPVGIVEDFEANIREELDFRREAENMVEFNRIMAEHGQSQVVAPRPAEGLTTKRVLVMERFYGHRVDDVEQLRASKVDGEEKLLAGMRAWFQCMIHHGFFHGDVHAGNLMALADGRIGFLDFGIVGRFPRERREQVTDYLMAFAAGDFKKLAEVMAAMGAVGGGVDMEALAKDLAVAYEPLLASEMAAIKYADLIPAILRTSVRHGMRLPRDFVLVTKQMLYFDRYAKLLAPTLNVFRDPRIVAALAMDVMQARMQPA
ncbi:MAG TPA: AarF/UbiB family protein [Polyangiaceae bacterium]|nr:AarF/UbiB family protein [Polyangiaceae bacterium]